MATKTGQQIVNNAWITAQDTTGGTGVRWPAAECLLWINSGQRDIVTIQPKAFVKRATPVAQAGTRQDLQGLGLNDGIIVIDVVRNFAPNGTTPRRSITAKERVIFDEQLPNWHNEVADQAQHWTQDERDPAAFYVYPAITGGGRIEVIYSAAPPELTDLAQTISVPDIYANALEMYVLARFYMKDAIYTKNPQLSERYLGLFQGLLGYRNSNVMANKGAGAAKAAGG